MRLRLYFAIVVVALLLSACGGSSKSKSTTTTSATTTTLTTSTTKTTIARLRHLPKGGTNKSAGGSSAPGSPSGAGTQPSGSIPSGGLLAGACAKIPALGSSVGQAANLRDRLVSASGSISGFIGTPSSGSLARSERLRAQSVLRAMNAVFIAAERYIAGPTSANRQALVKAVQVEAGTARSETLSQCAIPGS